MKSKTPKKPAAKRAKKAVKKTSPIKKEKDAQVFPKRDYFDKEPANLAKARSKPLLRPVGAFKVRRAKATSFADPADVRQFKLCKRRGHTDMHCFKFGDNGIGVWGDNTAQEHKPMVALPPEHMAERFGQWRDAKHAVVSVTVGRLSTKAIVADRMPFRRNRRHDNMIDLNPATLKQLGLKAPLLVDAEWTWV